MSNDLIAVVIVLLLFLLVGFPVHEFSHALAAWRLGDGTARLFGRLTLNPVRHFDPMGGSLLAFSMILSTLSGAGLFGFGWAKPTPVNPVNLRGGRRAEALVAAAGPLSNLILAAAAALPLRAIVAARLDVPGLLVEVLFYFIVINVILMIFNLLPIPPLDGSRVLFALLPPATAWRWRPILEQYGVLILFLAIFIPLPGGTVVSQVFSVIADPLIGLLVGL